MGRQNRLSRNTPDTLVNDNRGFGAGRGIHCQHLMGKKGSGSVRTLSLKGVTKAAGKGYSTVVCGARDDLSPARVIGIGGRLQTANPVPLQVFTALGGPTVGNLYAF